MKVVKYEKQMELFISLKKLIEKINKLDEQAKYLSQKKSFTTNPFNFVQNRTYAWIEKVKDANKCELRKNNSFKK